MTIAVNPKEYLEVLQNFKLNKKHKGIKKGSSRMEFESFSKQINSLVNFDTFEKLPAEYKQVSRLTVDKGEMVKKKVTKTKFLQMNYKRFYFPNGVHCLPIGHRNLKEIGEFKKEKGQKIERYFWDEKNVLLRMEKKCTSNHPRLYILHQILMSQPKIFNIN